MTEGFEGADLELFKGSSFRRFDITWRVVVDEMFDAADGSLLRRYEYSYEDHDLWTLYRGDSDGDGVIDWSRATSWTCL